MLDPKEIAKQEQSLASLKEVYPQLLWAMYEGSCKAGFSEEQAMKIVLAQVAQTNSTAKEEEE